MEKLNKGLVVAVIILAATTVGFGMMALAYYSGQENEAREHRATRLDLAKANGILRTGPCGDTFSVVVDIQDDDLPPQYAVAGEIITESLLRNYSARTDPSNGDYFVVVKEPGGYEKVVMTRKKK